MKYFLFTTLTTICCLFSYGQEADPTVEAYKVQKQMELMETRMLKLETVRVNTLHEQGQYIDEIFSRLETLEARLSPPSTVVPVDSAAIRLNAAMGRAVRQLDRFRQEEQSRNP